jgi:hypothetical protein
MPAPQSPTPQPNFVPFKSIVSRKTQNSTSTEQDPTADAEGMVHDQLRQSISAHDTGVRNMPRITSL